MHFSFFVLSPTFFVKHVGMKCLGYLSWYSVKTFLVNYVCIYLGILLLNTYISPSPNLSFKQRPIYVQSRKCHFFCRICSSLRWFKQYIHIIQVCTGGPELSGKLAVPEIILRSLQSKKFLNYYQDYLKNIQLLGFCGKNHNTKFFCIPKILKLRPDLCNHSYSPQFLEIKDHLVSKKVSLTNDAQMYA